MMGVFHARSENELRELCGNPASEDEQNPIAKALKDVSMQSHEDVWFK
jgi:hypothetical protein